MPSETPAPLSPLLPLWLRLLIWAVVLAVLLAVFALYTQGEFMRTLADQLWACF